MSDVIGKGVIEVSADSSKLKAGIDDAKRSIKGLGEAGKEASTKASASIDRYIARLQVQQKTAGMSTRETELYKLSIRGASEAQLKAADSALKLSEAYKNGIAVGDKIRASFLAIGLAAGTGLIAASIAFDNLVKKAGDFQDMAEKTGDTAENIASLAVAAGTAGVGMDTVVGAANKLTKGLTGVDDESKAAGAAIAALGLDIDGFKQLKPADQIETVAKALNGFQDGADKSAVAMALFGKSGAEILPFLKELGSEGGRQVLLTEQQIQLADEYADKQAKLAAQISMHAQAIATEMLPALADFTGAVSDLAKDEEFAATASDLLRNALSGAIAIFQTVAVVGSDVGFVFKMVGQEIGAIAAQLNALAHGDIDGFSAISDAVKEDSEKARLELDRFQARIMSIGTSQQAPVALPSIRPSTAPTGRPKLKYNGTVPKKSAGGAGQISKSELSSDLQRIKAASDEIISTYANAEKIMEATRAAGLLDEKEYYAAKLSFLQLNSQAQEKELQNEISRLQQEKLTGKEKIDNDRKIAETQAKLNKVRADSAANTTVLSIQEEAANKKIAQSYLDAQNAAQAYLETVKRQYSREVDGIGKGAEYRDYQAGRNTIDDRMLEKRQGLEGDLRRGDITQEKFDTYLSIAEETYNKEVEAYDQRTEAIKEKQADWINGFDEAVANYKTRAQDISGQTAEMFTNTFDGLTNGIASSISQAILYGEDFGESMKAVALSVADAFITSFIKIQIQKLLIDKTAAAGYAATIAAQSQAMVAMAGLNAFAATAAIPIVGPALAPAAAAAAIAASEAMAATAIAASAMSVASARNGFDVPAGVNPLTQLHEKEMVLPAPQADVIRDLANGGGSDQGARSESSGGVTIINQTSAKIGKVTEQKLSNGERALIIQEAVAATAAQFADPNSKTSRGLSRNFSIQRSR